MSDFPGASVRVLITGAGGFVGSHLPQSLRRICGDDIGIMATSKDGGHHPIVGELQVLDVLDRTSLAETFERYNPTHVIHLAGLAAPTVANANPRLAWQIHLDGALNLADAILARTPECWLLHVGTGLVYGDSAKPGHPLDENAVLAPVDEYAASKAAADLALGALAHRGLKCLRLRPFNHAGPGQTDSFVLSAFARQIAGIEAGLSPPQLRVGNLDARRDFLDVRDVTDAYALAVKQAASLEAGLILNIASGVPRRIGDVLKDLLSRSSVRIDVTHDPKRMRPSDLPCVVGNADRVRGALGWSPQRSFDDTLSDILNDWRLRVRNSQRR